MDKQCFKCRETKPLSEFYKHPRMADGHLGKCKACGKRDVAEREAFLRKNDKEWLAAERQRCRAKMKRRRELGLEKAVPRASRMATTRKWIKSNPEKKRARSAANSALKAGKLVKPTACQKCGQVDVKLEKHHDDYSKPLDVTWLCTSCHGRTRHLA